MSQSTVKPTPPKEVLAWRIAEFAAASRVSRSKMYELLKSGNGPRVTRVGGVPVILRDDGVAWLRAQRSE